MSEQAFLFLEPAEDPTLVTALVEYAHTGKSLQRDPEQLRAMLEDFLAGLSERELSRRYHVGRNTLRAGLRELEAAGKLEPLKKRVSDRLLRLGQLAIGAAEQALEAGDIDPRALPALIGVPLEKAALLAGEATHRLDVVEKMDPAAAWLAFQAQMKPADVIDVPATDSEGERDGTKGGATDIAGPGAERAPSRDDRPGSGTSE